MKNAPMHGVFISTYGVSRGSPWGVIELPAPNDNDKLRIAAALSLVLWADNVFADVEVFRFTPENTLNWQLRISPCTLDFWKKIWDPKVFSGCEPRSRWDKISATESGPIVVFRLCEENAGTYDFIQTLNARGLVVQYLPADFEKLDRLARRQARERERAEWRRRERGDKRKLPRLR
jgi:hypothetical protein